MSVVAQNNRLASPLSSPTSRDSADENSVVRKIINSAVYVEKSLPEMQPCAPSYNCYVSRPKSSYAPKKTVRCCCGSNPTQCPCHPVFDSESLELQPTKKPEQMNGHTKTLNTVKSCTCASDYYNCTTHNNNCDSGRRTSISDTESSQYCDTFRIDSETHAPINDDTSNPTGTEDDLLPLTMSSTSDSGTLTPRVITDDLYATQSLSNFITRDEEFPAAYNDKYERAATASISDKCSVVTVRENDYCDDDLHLSWSSLSQNNYIDSEEKELIVKSWLAKKEKERKRKLLRQQRQKEEEQRRRQDMIERERENFRQWLMEKKREEIKAKNEIKKKAEEERQKQEEKEKKQVENELMYKLWLQRKKRDELGKYFAEICFENLFKIYSSFNIEFLEKKIKEKINELDVLQDKEKRKEENKLAFDEWLKNSRTKPKPIRMNQGLKSKIYKRGIINVLKILKSISISE